MSRKKESQKLLMGNEAIALGIIENGCTLAASYPGTPASEILSSVARLKSLRTAKTHVEWSVNEKCAFEVSLANSYMGARSAVAMKQVGLNVALDPLMSAAYTGVIGGFLICAADDPGPHSSQTEQDSRLLALFAKIPVFDPATPQQAHDYVRDAFELSEKYELPVMLRPTTRVCHARQNIMPGALLNLKRKSMFSKDPARWAATPKHRLKLHKDLNKKIALIAREKKYQPVLFKKSRRRQPFCILSSGVASAYVIDILNDARLHNRIDLYTIPMPYPLHAQFLQTVTRVYKKILVIEETYPVIEMQLADRRNTYGKMNGFVPQEGEITPDSINIIIHKFLKLPVQKQRESKPGGRRPSLCSGCPHRASFFAIKKAFPKAIYPGDIGCYTLGINFGAVDTCLCMGASINQAAGFYHSMKTTGSEEKPVVATIGDSTFIHSGITALINAVYNNARFVLVILDNSTTAMTGNQPTAATGILPDGTAGKNITLEKLLEGCGIRFLKIVDPYNVPDTIAVLKEADAFTRSADGGIAVVIARHPCLMSSKKLPSRRVTVSRQCTGCQYCITNFECPALSIENDMCTVKSDLCSGCGVCVHVCPVHAITIE